MSTTTTGLATSFIQFSRASNATVTDADGKIKWAGHNLLTNSESFDASAWLKINNASTNPAVTANAAAAPNSTTTADRVDFGVIDAAADYSIIYQQQTVVAGTHTAAFWVKAFAAGDVGKKIWAFIYNNTTKGLQTVTLTADWQYITMSGSMDAGAAQLQIGTFGSSAVTGGENQAAVSVLLWGAHLYRSDLGGMVLNPARGDAYYPTTPRNLLGLTESLTTGWTNSNTTDSIVTETNPNGLASSVEVTATAGNGTLLGSLSLLASPYTFSIWLKRKTGTGTVEITVDGTTYVTAAVTSDWQRFSTTLTPSAGTKTPGIRLVTSGDAVYAWGAQLSDSASLDAYSPVYGAAVTSAAYYAPRLDYSGSSLAALGLLVEEQRSNLVLYSDAFTASGWLTTGSPTISSNSDTSPAGTQTATKFTMTGSFGGVYRSTTVASGTTVTASVFIKAVTANVGVDLTITDNSVDYQIRVNASTGALVSASAGLSSYSISDAGNGFFRVTATRVLAAANPNVFIGRGGGASVSDAFIVYGAQLEAGSFATSYIPTGASTATRTADVASVSTQAFPYSASEGTIVVNVSVLTGATAQNNTLYYLNNGSTNYIRNWIWAGAGGVPRLTVVSSNSTVADLTGGSISAMTPFKTAAAYKANDFAYSLNAGAVATGTSGAVPAAAVDVKLGSVSNDQFLNGHLRQITYLPRRLPNADLQARTV